MRSPMTPMLRILVVPVAAWLLGAGGACFAAAPPVTEELLAPLTAAYMRAVKSGEGWQLDGEKVVVIGAPLADVQVNFDPTGKGRPASGITNNEGKFMLTTINPNDGAMRGEYKVTVVKLGPKVDLGGKDAFRDMQMKGSQKNDSGIHGNYMNFAKTPLTVTVPVKSGLVLPLKKDGT